MVTSTVLQVKPLLFSALLTTLPQWMEGLEGWQAVSISVVLLAAALLIGWGAQVLIFRLVQRWVRTRRQDFELDMLAPLRKPLRLLIPVVSVVVIIPVLQFPAATELWVVRTTNILLIVAVAWLLIAGMRTLRNLAIPQYAEASKDSMRARRLLTQFNVLQSIVNVFIVLIAIAAVLMTFETVRDIGTKILASAGVAGIIIGFAAQRSIATLIAGIQIAIAQPIRLDDVVTIEGEQGEVEEITLTYVVIKLYDLRRLIVPINYFIEKPFLNYTRHTKDLYATALVYVDHRVKVEPVRQEFMRIIKANKLWDGKYAHFAVTKTTENTVELRARASATDTDSAFDLQCLLREELLAYLRDHQPEALPHSRRDIDPGAVVGKNLQQSS
jgi:small-conductance mechanosensitive channel